jgi:hypothetical protein
MSYSFVLMPQQWPDAIDYLARPIIGDRGTLQVPWLAISSGVANGQFQLVSRSDLDRETALEIIQAATAQLESQSVVWNVAEQRGLIFNRAAEVPTLSEAGWGWIASELTIAPLARCEAQPAVDERCMRKLAVFLAFPLYINYDIISNLSQ